MEATDENIPLDMDEFVLKKAIDGMANGVPKKSETLEIKLHFHHCWPKTSKSESIKDHQVDELFFIL